jgi:hypothetical protein
MLKRLNDSRRNQRFVAKAKQQPVPNVCPSNGFQLLRICAIQIYRDICLTCCSHPFAVGIGVKSTGFDKETRLADGVAIPPFQPPILPDFSESLSLSAP